MTNAWNAASQDDQSPEHHINLTLPTSNPQAQPTSPENPEANNPASSFSAEDYAALSVNEHARYQRNSHKIGHAVIAKMPDGNSIAYQYAIPENGEASAPIVRPMINIEAIEPRGLHRYRAQSPNGTRMFASRFVDLEYHEAEETKQMRIACFSPPPPNKSEPFWGSEKPVPLFRNDFSEDEKQEMDLELGAIPVSYKGGRELEIEAASIRQREEIKRRTPDQNTVMGESAKDCFAMFLETFSEELHPEMRELFERAINAPLNNAFYGNHRPEWLHLEGFSLTPISQNPQRKDNLAAAPRWANTEMMVLERIARWFALHRPEDFVRIKPHFEMLLDSEIAKKIRFEVTIEEKDRFVRLLQEIDPLIKFPVFRKASDLAQSTAIINSLLRNIPPAREQRIREIHSVPSRAPIASFAPSVPVNSAHHEQKEQPTMTTPPAIPVSSSSRRSRSQYPTGSRFENSVVQVLTTFSEPDYDSPWKGVDVMSCSGTGLVIENQGKKYILTNAHCVENAVIVRIRLANDRKKKYEAKRTCVSYQCDLALLEISDPEFAAKTVPARLGEMTRLRKKVYTVGFPMGGNEISITKGIVSRIETGEYAMSGLDMLQVQVDSAINSGNSGGPVFSSDGLVMGVAFQGISGAQSLGYMIPVPIIHHFLAEAFSGRPYRGFPVLPISFQTLENPALRKFYGMQEEQSGLRIRHVNPQSNAYNKLKPDDILLAIDGFPISNEGTVDIPETGNCIDLQHVTHMKYIGDSVNLDILRRDPASGEFNTLAVNVTLDHTPYEGMRVPAPEHDKMPTYFIASGIALTPLTRNYLEQGGADLADQYLVEDGCRLGNTPKKSPDEEIVIVNDILDCQETLGYSSYRNSIIKEINGTPINNIRDAVLAIESNTEPMHSMTTAGKKKIVVKNMDRDEHAKLLSQYKIHFDRSEDLRPGPLSENRNELVQPDFPDPLSPESVQFEEIDLPARALLDAHADDLPLPARLPGLERYSSTLDSLYERYSQLPEEYNSASDEDFSTDVSESSEASPIGSEAEEDSDSESRPPSQRKAARSSSQMGFFKRQRDHSPDEPPSKRQRFSRGY